MLARRPSDVLDNLLSRFLQWSGLLSHLRSYERYDEPETLPYSIRPFCPMSADGGHEFEVLVKGRVTRVRKTSQQKRIAVRGRIHDCLGGYVSAGTRPVLDDELLAEPLRQPLSYQACH